MSERDLEELRRLEPPAEDAARREQLIRNALDLAAAEMAARSLRAAGAHRVGAPLALAAAALLAVWVFTARDDAPGTAEIARPAAPLVLRSGSVQANGAGLHGGSPVPASTAIAVGAVPAELSLRDGTRLHAAQDSAFSYSDGSEERVHLERGEVVLRVQPRAKSGPLVVETDELSAWVVGTRFAVTRAKHGAHFATTVSVAEGLVRVVAKPRGETQLLGAGGRVTFGPGSNPEPPSAPAAAERPAAPARAAISTVIRQKLKEGAIGTARRLIERAQRERAAGVAELAMLEAEADLAERRHERAKARYLAIVTRYPHTSEAELSLFAAAQLSRGAAGVDLLQRYLARYPDGRFAKEAQRLLATLDTAGSR
jgi:hypothetical protein